MITDQNTPPPVQRIAATPAVCLLAIAGPAAAVVVDAQGRVERIAHRDHPEVPLDQPRPMGGGAR